MSSTPLRISPPLLSSIPFSSPIDSNPSTSSIEMTALSQLSLDVTPTPPTTRTLPDIPLDVARILATFLTLDSALSLARTCRALRDAGEIRIYRDLDTTGGPHPGIAAFPLDDSACRVRFQIIMFKAHQISNCTQAYTLRLSCAQSLRVEPIDDVANPSANSAQSLLIQVVACQLRHLDILSMPGQSSTGAPTISSLVEDQFFGVLHSSGIGYPQLKHIRYAYPTRAGIPIDAWILRAPNLEEIHICSAERSFAPPVAKVATSSKLLRLRKITIENVMSYTVGDRRIHNLGMDVLGTLLKAAPNVECVRLEGFWRPAAKDAATRAIGEAKFLKSFVGWHSPENRELSVHRGISVQKLGKVLLPSLEEVAVGAVNWGEVSEQAVCADLIVLSAPVLRRMTYFVTPGDTPAEYASVPLGLSSCFTSHFSAWSIHRMKRAPILTSILFLGIERPIPSMWSADRIEPELFIDPSRWIAEGHRGIVIHQFCNMTDEFWHIKVLSRAVASKDGIREPHLAVKRYLNHFTHFRGRTVPRWVLDAVYAASGDDVNSMQGGRDLVLGGGRVAWAILERWRETLGDGSDVHDGLGVPGMNDDYDVESDED